MFDIFAGKDPQKALQRAREYMREGKTDAAIRTLEDNLTDGEESFDLYIELSKLHYEAENRTRATELLRSIQGIAPSRSDELIAAVSDLFYRRTSIDIGDFLLQLHVARQEYEDLSKVLRAFNEREIKLLVMRYEKIRQMVTEKSVLSRKDVENVLILGTIKFFTHNGKDAISEIEPVIGVPAFNKSLIAWARVIGREYFNDQYASLLQIKVLASADEYEELMNLAHRALEKFPDATDPLIEVFSQAHPPKELASAFQQFVTELYIKKGDLDASIDRLMNLLKKDPSKADDVVKALRELERINPKNLTVHYGLADAYLEGRRVSAAISSLEKILEIDPSQHDQVMGRYKKAFDAEPNNPQAIAGLVNYHLRDGSIEAAIDIVESAYNKDSGLIDEYVLDLNLILEKDLTNTRALYLLGMCYTGKGEKDNALVIVETLMEEGHHGYVEKILAEAVKRSPDDPGYLNIYARNLAVLGKEEQAMKLVRPLLRQPDKTLTILPALDVIINKKPEFSDEVIPLYERYKKNEPFIFELALARVHAFRGDYNRSVKSFEACLVHEDRKDSVKRALIEVVKERPKAVELLLAAARIFMKDGEVEIATEFFKTAQAVDPKAFFEIIDEFYDTLKTFPKDREVRVLLIDTFFNRKLWDRVIEEAKKGTEVFGQEAQYFNLKLGQALVESGNLTDGVRPLMLSLDGEENYANDVIRYLNKILEIDKSNVPAHFARGRALARAKQVDEAVEEYLLTARIVPARAEYVLDELRSLSAKAIANPRIIFAMGSVEITLKRNDEAIKHLLQACELDNAMVKRVIPLFEKLLTTASSPLLEYSMARVYHLAGINNSAVQLFISAQAQNKEYREPAITELKQICAEDPKDLESRKGLAEIYFGYNNYEDALALVEEIYDMSPKESGIKSFIFEILKKNPGHIPSYFMLLKVFLSENDHVKAIEVAKKLIELSPSETVKVIEIMMPFHEISAGLHFYSAAVYKEIGDLATAVSLFGQLFLKDTSYADAIAVQIREMTVKNSNLPDAYVVLGKISAFKREYEKAIDDVKRAIALKPDRYEELQLLIARYCFEMGDIKRAVEVYNEVLGRTQNRKAIYRLIRKIHHDYIEEKIKTITGGSDDERINRSSLYLFIDDVKAAEKELRFVPASSRASKMRTLLGARIYLKKNRPMDAFETIRNLAVDAETAPVYADVYEALGSYEAAASVLRQCDAIGLSERISKLEMLAQSRIVSKGRYYIEGRI